MALVQSLGQLGLIGNLLCGLLFVALQFTA